MVMEQKPIAFSFDSLASNSMKSKNPHSGCRQVEVSKCLDTTDPNPCKNQGGIAVLEPVAFAMQAFGQYKESDVASGMKARDYKDATDLVVQGEPVIIDRAFFNQGENAKYDPQYYTDGVCPTLVARGPHACQYQYIVRRLTPTECARLQGFADDWGEIDRKDDFTDEEYQFWLEVRNTHAAINGKTTKHYTKAQMLKWYNKLHVNSSEYKMWGNGIALPPTLYVMQGICDAAGKEDDNDHSRIEAPER